MTDFTPGALIRVQRIGLLRTSTVHTQPSWTECLGGGVAGLPPTTGHEDLPTGNKPVKPEKITSN